MKFRNRIDAGRQLANVLRRYAGKAVIVGLPRGGVVVAAEVAKALKCPLTIINCRKLGAPGNPELAIGAVAEDGTLYLDDDIVENVGASKKHIEREKQAQMEKIAERQKTYPSRKVGFAGKTVIIVDDGVATGATMIAAVRSAGHQGAKEVVIAVPVAPTEAEGKLLDEADDMLCLSWEHNFIAVGEFYEEFNEVTDKDVIEILTARA
ncbi:phosphoribosyltransferase [Candidatus Woesearchaeota archaeon]|nr:phosphoribosyltransferase [Candidatus Woesearchaeota archaeon]